MEFTFKVGSKIKEAWGLYKDNFGNIILFIVAAFVLNAIVNSLFLKGGRGASIPSFAIFYLVSMTVSFLIYYIMIKSTLNMLDGKGFSPFSKEVLSLSSFWNFIKTNILIGLILIPVILVSVGLSFIGLFLGKGVIIFIVLILFVLYVYFITRLMPASFLSVDKNQSARKNISEAWSLTKECWGTILGKSVLIFLFMILGLLALVVGLVITYPIAVIVMIMMYRELIKFNSGSVTVAPEIVSIPEVPKNDESISPEKIQEIVQ